MRPAFNAPELNQIVRPWCMPLGLMLGLALNGCAASSTVLDPPPQAQEVAAWPVALDATEGLIELYQPQPECMERDTLSARAVVSLTRPGAAAPLFGAVWFTAQVATDLDARTATIRKVTVGDVCLPGPMSAMQQEFALAIGKRLSTAEVTYPLDELTATLDTGHLEQVETNRIRTAPPRILFSTTPATLILVNGPPQVLPMQGLAGVSRVANTPFILLIDDASRRYYLKAGPRWVSAPNLSGPWADSATVPPRIAAASAQLAPPTTRPTTAPTLEPAASNAKIIVVTEPTELIVTTGEPQFAPLSGASAGALLYANNTASDLFLNSADHHYYVLLSGRWFSAASLQGPWQYVASNRLPPTFAQIAADSPKADVLPFVAGTPQAHQAVLDASIPRTAAIRRDADTNFIVDYDGAPRFQDVPESPGVAYALNTPEDVLQVNGEYYLCHQAVWYESGAPIGPWMVSWSVPPSIYTLPPSCPAYHVRYVYVYEYQSDYVTCGYLPGYLGTFTYGPTIVYGTGYTYPGWCGTAYFPTPSTWGFAPRYDAGASTWEFNASLYRSGPGWFAYPAREHWWRDHPSEWWGSHRWWGPGGFVHSHPIRSHAEDADGHATLAAARRSGGDYPEARLPGTEHAGPGWNNLYARAGNAGRAIPPERVLTFTPDRRAAIPRGNVFVGSDGRVFRQINTPADSRKEMYP